MRRTVNGDVLLPVNDVVAHGHNSRVDLAGYQCFSGGDVDGAIDDGEEVDSYKFLADTAHVRANTRLPAASMCAPFDLLEVLQACSCIPTGSESTVPLGEWLVWARATWYHDERMKKHRLALFSCVNSQCSEVTVFEGVQHLQPSLSLIHI